MGRAQSGALCGHHLILPPQRPYEVLPFLLLLPVSMRKLLAQKASNLPKDIQLVCSEARIETQTI